MADRVPHGAPGMNGGARRHPYYGGPPPSSSHDQYQWPRPPHYQQMHPPPPHQGSHYGNPYGGYPPGHHNGTQWYYPYGYDYTHHHHRGIQSHPAPPMPNHGAPSHPGQPTGSHSNENSSISSNRSKSTNTSSRNCTVQYPTKTPTATRRKIENMTVACPNSRLFRELYIGSNAINNSTIAQQAAVFGHERDSLQGIGFAIAGLSETGKTTHPKPFLTGSNASVALCARRNDLRLKTEDDRYKYGVLGEEVVALCPQKKGNRLAMNKRDVNSRRLQQIHTAFGHAPNEKTKKAANTKDRIILSKSFVTLIQTVHVLERIHEEQEPDDRGTVVYHCARYLLENVLQLTHAERRWNHLLDQLELEKITGCKAGTDAHVRIHNSTIISGAATRVLEKIFLEKMEGTNTPWIKKHINMAVDEAISAIRAKAEDLSIGKEDSVAKDLFQSTVADISEVAKSNPGIPALQELAAKAAERYEMAFGNATSTGEGTSEGF